MELTAVTQRPDDQSGEVAGLLAAAGRGDESAWRRIVALYARRVFALARSRVRSIDVAEELTQSVFVTVAAKLGGGEYTEQGRFESWLFRVAMNRVRDHIRRAKRQASAVDPSTLDVEVAPAGLTADRTDLDRLRAAMMELSDADREVVELRHHGGLSFKQMSELLDEPLGTLLARHHRALRKLKETLESTADRKAALDN